MSYSYYPNSNINTITYPKYSTQVNSPEATYTYNNLSLMASVSDGLSNTTNFNYDYCGNLISQVNAKSGQYLIYDLNNNLVNQQFLLNGQTSSGISPTNPTSVI